MNKRSLSALIVFNLVLLASVMVATLTPVPATAQIGGRGNYVMISAQVRGRANQAGIFILDMSRGTMYWINYTEGSDQIDVVARRDIGADLQAAQRSR